MAVPVAVPWSVWDIVCVYREIICGPSPRRQSISPRRRSVSFQLPIPKDNTNSRQSKVPTRQLKAPETAQVHSYFGYLIIDTAAWRRFWASVLDQFMGSCMFLSTRRRAAA